MFTSGGTESNNWAIKGAAARGLREGRAQVITSAIEHPAVLQVCQHLESTGVKVGASASARMRALATVV